MIDDGGMSGIAVYHDEPDNTFRRMETYRSHPANSSLRARAQLTCPSDRYIAANGGLGESACG